MSPSDPAVAVASAPAAPDWLRSAHQLFLISLILSITIGATAQWWRLWPGLIITELCCFLLPAWRFARATGGASAALRLEWPGFTPCALGLAIGASLIPLAGAMGFLGTKVLGYSIELPDTFWPRGTGNAAIYIAASVIAAPFCEEMVFRGYILSAYEHSGVRPRTAILAVAGLFTAIHLSPSRAPGIAVLALALTYVAWRTGSVWPSVAAHIGANGTAAAMVLLRSRWVDDTPSPELLFIGFPATMIAAICLLQLARRPAPPRPEPAPSIVEPGRRWPLVVAGMIVLLAAAGEIVTYRVLRPHAVKAPPAVPSPRGTLPLDR
jgi:membrane protease YdiL (CAAX protease family)